MTIRKIPFDVQTRWRNRLNDRGNGSFDTSHHSASGKAYHLNQKTRRRLKRQDKALGNRVLRQVGHMEVAEALADEADETENP